MQEYNKLALMIEKFSNIKSTKDYETERLDNKLKQEQRKPETIEIDNDVQQQ